MFGVIKVYSLNCSKVTLIMLQKISISNKCCFVFYFLFIKNPEKKVPMKILSSTSDFNIDYINNNKSFLSKKSAC